MMNIRNYLIATVIWFFVLYNIERLSAPINIASFVYLFVAAIAVLLLSVPELHHLSFLKLFSLSLIPYLSLKVILGYQVFGTNLPITISEIVFIGITIALTQRIGKDLSKLQDEIGSLTLTTANLGIKEFDIDQSQIYREIRRARRYHRSATLLAVSLKEKDVNLSIHRFIDEAKSNITQRYVMGQAANILSKGLKDMDVITLYNGHFVILLPETGSNDAQKVINRIEATIQDKLGLGVYVGYSTFPEEAVTFADMLERAEAKMKNAGVRNEFLVAEEVGISTTPIPPTKESAEGLGKATAKFIDS